MYAVLRNGYVTWVKDEIRHQEPYDSSYMQLFYGAPNIGQNLVWKPMSEDPSLFLSFLEKTSNSDNVAPILMR